MNEQQIELLEQRVINAEAYARSLEERLEVAQDDAILAHERVKLLEGALEEARSAIDGVLRRSVVLGAG